MFDNFYFFYPFLAYSVDYHRRQNSASIMDEIINNAGTDYENLTLHCNRL